MNGSIAPTAGLQSTCLKAGDRDGSRCIAGCDDFQIAVEGDAEKR